MIGLSTFFPVLLLALPAGETADRHNRRMVMLMALGLEIVSILALAIAAWRGISSIPLLLAAAFAFGIGRAYFGPAGGALGPMLVPRALLPRAIGWNSLAWQISAILGPAVGGFLVSLTPAAGYFTVFGLYLLTGLGLTLIRADTTPQQQPGSRWTLMKEGLAYVWRQKLVFGAISLDLAAVLLGGATALLPVFARDILHVGASGFGLLRAAPAIGATVIAVLVSARPPRSKAGLVMFAGVFVFGAATTAFGLSRAMWLSVLSLAVVGGADMLSVYVRQTLIQLTTPDVMRGRVSAVSQVFIGASNELGEFESGVAARLLGPVGAAVFGGVGAMIAAGLWAKWFPALRKADHLT
jgi:MFS family permease